MAGLPSPTTLKFLASTVDPLSNTVAPFGSNNMNTYIKRFDVSAVISSSYERSLWESTVLENLKLNSGIFVWLPRQGVSSIHRLVVVPKGTLSTGKTIPGRDNQKVGSPVPVWTPTLSWFMFFQHQGFVMYGILNVTEDFCLPTNSLHSKEWGVSISPNANQSDFSSLRVISGIFETQSDTRAFAYARDPSTAELTLNGSFAACAVNDLKGLVKSAFSVSSMMQTAVTNQDAVKDVPATDGVTCVLGPDFSPVFGPPYTRAHGAKSRLIFTTTFSQDSEIPIASGMQQFKGEVVFPRTSPTSPTPFLSPGVTKCIFRCWVTRVPMEIKSDIGWAGYTMYLPDLSLDGFFSFEFGFAILPEELADTSTQGLLSDGQPAGYEENIDVCFQHMFCSVGENGALYYNQCHDLVPYNPHIGKKEHVRVIRNFRSSPRGRMGKFNDYNPGNWGPGQFQSTGVECGGMYIGTAITVLTTNVGTVAGTHKPHCIVRNPEAGALPYLAVYAEEYDDNTVQVARVVRYDNMGRGQNIRASAVLMAECVPGMNTASIVQTTISDRCEFESATEFVAAVYAAPEFPINRVWRSKSYRTYIERSLPLLQPTDFIRTNNSRVIRAGMASGVFKILPLSTQQSDFSNILGSALQDVSSEAGLIDEAEEATNIANNPLAFAHQQRAGSTITGPSVLWQGSNVVKRLREVDSVLDKISTIKGKQMFSNRRKYS